MERHRQLNLSPLGECVKNEIDAFVGILSSFQGGRDPAFSEQFHARLNTVEEFTRDCEAERPALFSYCLTQTDAELSQSLIHRQGREKPLGYAGDYQIIDWTYQQFAASPGRGKLWDEFYHAQDAPRAVCDRKERFGRILSEIAISIPRRPIRILNVASGPGRELLDGAVVANLRPDDLDVLCVELDQRAIDYAMALLGQQWQRAVRFYQGNALTFRSSAVYDLVWCAGLFDYLDNRRAASLLRTLWKAVAPGGLLVVGNFATTHRTRPWIEWCGNWFLIHRDEAGLRRLADEADIPALSVSHEVDRWGAIRFLMARNLSP